MKAIRCENTTSTGAWRDGKFLRMLTFLLALKFSPQCRPADAEILRSRFAIAVKARQRFP